MSGTESHRNGQIAFINRIMDHYSILNISIGMGHWKTMWIVDD